MEPMKKLFDMLKIVGDGTLMSDSTKSVFLDYNLDSPKKVSELYGIIDLILFA